jgi:glycopeptide antibiotics resistance protein
VDRAVKHRRLLVALFLVYLVLLAWVVLWRLELPYLGGVEREIALVPFATGDDSAKSPFELAFNFVLFVPFGLYLGLLAPLWRWWKVALVVAGASLAMELAQYVLAVGVSDITDLLLNTAGGLTGFGLLALARRGLQGRTLRVLTRVCAIGTVVALLAVGIFMVSPIHYAPPRGGDLPIGSMP